MEKIINYVNMKKTIIYYIIAMLSAFVAASMASSWVYAADTCSEHSTMAAPKEYKTVTFVVSMHCHNCVKKINENVGFEKGVKALTVSLDDKTVVITYDTAKTDEASLKTAIEKLGYSVEVAE